MIHPSAKLSLLVALVSMLSGCKDRSESLVEVSGQVLSEGKPLRVKPGEELKILFCTVDSQTLTLDLDHPTH